MNRFHVRSALTVVLAVVALTSCGSDNDFSSAATESPQADVAPGGADSGDHVISDDHTGDQSAADHDAGEASVATDSPAAVPGDGDADGGNVLVDPSPDRLLIVEVTVGVQVTDVAKTVSDVIGISQRNGGQVYGSDVRLTDPTNASGEIVVKLPPQNVESMIAEVSALGRQISRVQNTDDVTDRVTDITTRITTAQESVARVQALLANATDLGDVVMLEGELTTRQTALEELLAEQRNLGNSTALATVTIDLSTAPAAVVDEVVVEPPVKHHDGIGDAFRKGGHAFVVAGAAVLIFIGYTAPFLAIALVVGLIGWVVIRRRARRLVGQRRGAWPEPEPGAAAAKVEEPAGSTSH